jgi:mannosyl-oligosaccharide alpha-1,2-mannosidase
VACFDGGSFILGGLVLEEQKYIDFGLALVNGCHDTYASTATGIGPEVFQWVENSTSPKDPNNPPAPADQQAFYEKSGFYITASDYVLRPEYLESVYYAFRATGNQMYRDWAWDAFVAINTTCAVGSGYAELNDVNVPGGGGFSDFQDSFFFAEVLKYAYLIHAPVRYSVRRDLEGKSANVIQDNAWQVENNGVNQWVFNTEAHPFKVYGPPI